MTAGKTVSLEVVSQTRERVGEVQVPESFIDSGAHGHLLYEVVKSQLAARRAGTHATKTRGFVSGGGKKPWRQKGTGRARAGSTRSPLWRGGATIFGPQPRSYDLATTKEARRVALRSAIATRHAAGKLLIVDSIQLPEAKTKKLVEVLRGLGIQGSVVLVVTDEDHTIHLAGRNLPNVKVLPPVGLNVRDVLGHEFLVLSRAATDLLAVRLQGGRGGVQ